ncbi:MAG TPA: hypothetical protein VJ349_16565, partial [Stellaceae bacterium]|nr:hypothetical protein [Stellaceae bacterium]
MRSTFSAARRARTISATLKESPTKVAILDDYQNVALEMADWSPVARRAEITVFNDHERWLAEATMSADGLAVAMRHRGPAIIVIVADIVRALRAAENVDRIVMP